MEIVDKIRAEVERRMTAASDCAVNNELLNLCSYIDSLIQQDIEYSASHAAQDYSFNADSQLCLHLNPEQLKMWKYEIEKAYDAGRNDIASTIMPDELEKEVIKVWKDSEDNGNIFELGRIRAIAHHFVDWEKRRVIDKLCEFLKSYRQDYPNGTGYVAGIVNDKTIDDICKEITKF